MGKPIVVGDDNFDQAVLQAKTPVVVDFWAARCGPCRMMAPVIEQLAKEYEGRITFAKLDVDQNPKMSSKYAISNIPALLLFKSGKPVLNVVGLRAKAELKRSLEAAL